MHGLQSEIDRVNREMNALGAVNLAALDENGGPLDRLLQSLLKVRGLAARNTSAPEVRFDSALALGDVWALDQLWREIGCGISNCLRFFS